MYLTSWLLYRNDVRFNFFLQNSFNFLKKFKKICICDWSQKNNISKKKQFIYLEKKEKIIDQYFVYFQPMVPIRNQMVLHVHTQVRIKILFSITLIWLCFWIFFWFVFWNQRSLAYFSQFLSRFPFLFVQNAFNFLSDNN